MQKIPTRHIPKLAKKPLSVDLTALLGRIFGGVYQYLQGIFGTPTND